MLQLNFLLLDVYLDHKVLVGFLSPFENFLLFLQLIFYLLDFVLVLLLDIVPADLHLFDFKPVL